MNTRIVSTFAALMMVTHGAHAFCFDEAASRYKVDKSLLMAIAKTESSYRANAVNVNSNGSEDIGLMQINDSWLPQLKQWGIDRARLFDPCTNINVGAWVLANNFVQHGRTWKAVGAYNARSTDKQEVYAMKVWKNLNLGN
jgi:soluble lytic murein transglycosylase-like protein